eukprot:gene26944-biopygen17519
MSGSEKRLLTSPTSTPIKAQKMDNE